jgi:hypothetical protein
MSEQEPLTTSDLAGAGRTAEEPTRPRAEESAGDVGVTPSRTDADAKGAQAGAGSGASPLFEQGDRDGFQDRWNAIQTGFVDEPRKSVEQADALVAEAMSRLAKTFAHERQTLESQWGEGADVSTEDLRVALQRYRSFFERLLSA